MGTIISLFLAGFSGLCTYGFVRENGGSEAQAQGAGIIVAIIVLLLLFLFSRWLKSPGGSAEPKAGNRRSGNGGRGGGDDGSPAPISPDCSYGFYPDYCTETSPEPQRQLAPQTKRDGKWTIWIIPLVPEPQRRPVPQRTEPEQPARTEPHPEHIPAPNWPQPERISVPNWPTRETGGNIHKEHPEWFE